MIARPAFMLLALLGLGACAQQESQAQAADDAACTAQANAQYRQNTLDTLARTNQNGLRYGAMPTQVFGAEQMGAQSDRQRQISDCEATGSNNGQTATGGFTPVTPHIVN